jgi:hypothetical protein
VGKILHETEARGGSGGLPKSAKLRPEAKTARGIKRVLWLLPCDRSSNGSPRSPARAVKARRARGVLRRARVGEAKAKIDQGNAM